MANQPNVTTREERLAAKLRENLRRRKAQARAQNSGAPGGGEPKGGDLAGGDLAGGDGPSQTLPEKLGRGAPDNGA